MEILTFEGNELDELVRFMRINSSGVYRFRIDVREDGIAVKVNEEMWSPTIRMTRKGS